MKRYDVQWHLWPDAVFEFLSKRDAYPRAERTAGGWTCHYSADAAIEFTPDFTDLSRQLEVIEETGLDIVMVSSLGADLLNFPGLDGAEARELALRANEARADLQRERPDKVVGVAVAPWIDADAALEVIDIAVDELGLKALSVPSNFDGTAIDSPHAEPIFARVAELGLPLLLHPVWSVFAQSIPSDQDHIEVMLGWPVDTSIAAMRLALGGTMERHPELKVVHHHAGGVIPALGGRIDKTAKMDPTYDLPHLPSVYLKRMYADTAVMSVETIDAAIRFYGEDHMLFASDHPFWPVADTLEVIEGHFEPPLERKVMETNAERLFRI